MQTTYFTIWLGDAVNDAVHQVDDVKGKGGAGKLEEEKMWMQSVGLWLWDTEVTWLGTSGESSSSAASQVETIAEMLNLLTRFISAKKDKETSSAFLLLIVRNCFISIPNVPL